MKERMSDYNTFQREREEIQDEMTACYDECASCRRRHSCRLSY
ncbi:hypothetical protein [Methanobacterium paludis]|nr:hypothetical protein [Methanobacterium paludis]